MGPPRALVPARVEDVGSVSGRVPCLAEQCGRVESNHHSQRRRGYSAVSSPVLSVRSRRRSERRDSLPSTGAERCVNASGAIRYLSVRLPATTVVRQGHALSP